MKTQFASFLVVAVRRVAVAALYHAAVFAVRRTTAALVIFGALTVSGLLSGGWYGQQSTGALCFLAGLLLLRLFAAQARDTFKALRNA